MITFLAGTFPGDEECGPIEIIDDQFLEGDEEFQVMLEMNSAYDRAEPLYTNVTIFDNDSEYRIFHENCLIKNRTNNNKSIEIFCRCYLDCSRTTSFNQ